MTGEGSCDKNDGELPELQIDIEPVYPVILRILGFFSCSFSRKYIIHGLRSCRQSGDVSMTSQKAGQWTNDKAETMRQ